MFCYLIKILILVLSVSIEQKAAELDGYSKYVYQMDLSEHCRRRVIPSVFLGRQVVGAYSQILQFSQLEVPYSCSVTVRTEMGSNIIVVIQVVSDVDFNETCKKHKEQLVIYEIGETFGGYWAQLPDSVMEYHERRKDRTYTLEPPKTKPETTATTTSITTEETTTKPQPIEPQEGRKEYISVEIPIVNVSYRLQPVETKPTPRTTSERYKLMQFLKGDEVKNSTKLQSDNPEAALESSEQSGKEGIVVLENVDEDGADPIVILKNPDQTGDESDEYFENTDFQVLVESLFTPDPRLTTPVNSITKTKKSHKYYPTVNRRFNFKKNNQLFAAKDALLSEKFPFTKRFSPLSTLRKNDNLSKAHKTQSSQISDTEKEDPVNPWDVIHILKNLSHSDDTTTQPPHEELAGILRRISHKKLNTSVYLAQDIINTDFTNLGTITTKREIDVKTTTGGSSSGSSTYLLEPNVSSKRASTSQSFNKSFNESNGLRTNDSMNNDINDHRSVVLLPLTLDVDTIILNATSHKKNLQDKSAKSMFQGATRTTTKKSDLITVSLVDHESWDNIVKSAGVMAVKLNQINATANGYRKQKANITRKPSKLKKRSMQPIDVEYRLHPHPVLNTRNNNITTHAPETFDRLEFQRLIELHDDEIHGRVAMKHLNQFRGPPRLNLCDFNVTASVYLLNSSRLVLSLSNFTFKRVTVVLTPARTLMNADAHCRETYLECQVSGARVCIDSLSACDGVPNCGSYEIYDEDRLRCGAAIGLRHNVYLAAMTFLAVLLTVVYSIHYWLKRCVPRVSEAFFIYTDAADNVLYLNTIMRSPHDIGVGTRASHQMLQEFMECDVTEIKESAWRRILNKAFGFLRCRRKKRMPKEDKKPETEHISATFTEMELRKLQTPGVDIAVQTDSSIHILPLDSRLSLHRISSTTSDANSNPPLDDLSMLKYFRSSRIRSVSANLSSNFDFKERPTQFNVNQRQSKEEEVTLSHDYSLEVDSIERIVTPLIHGSEMEIEEPDTKVKEKHLRFHDDATIIPDEEDDGTDVEKPSNSRRSVVFAPGKVSLIDHDCDDLVQQSSSVREFKSYFNWGNSKDKKKKSKKK